VILLVLIGLAVTGMPTRAAEPSGMVAVISDIHFDPFAAPDLIPRLVSSDPKEWPIIFASRTAQGFPSRGEDTNHALLASTLATLSASAGGTDLVVVSGDLLAHRFEEVAAQVLSTSPTSSDVRELAAKTALYVTEAVRAALPGRPILVALGNNDSECGDYQLEPGGPFLAALLDAVRDLAGKDRVAPDFAQTFTAGGYYAVGHPVLPGGSILVVNDVLWSTNYRNACGADGADASQKMLAWLERQLREARGAGRYVWLVHHIPVGIDPYATLHASTGLSCSARVTPFLKEPFASRFVQLLQEYAGTIQANFTGHTHQDSYRLVMRDGAAVGVEKVTPSISPVFGNNPGFHLFNYDRQIGDLTDFATWYLSNLEQASATVPGAWQVEYVFTQAYGERTYSAVAVARIAAAMLATDVPTETVRSTFRHLYPVSHGSIAAGELLAYACAIGHLTSASYAACYCPG
jgi:hypothetical protein